LITKQSAFSFVVFTLAMVWPPFALFAEPHAILAGFIMPFYVLATVLLVVVPFVWRPRGVFLCLVLLPAWAAVVAVVWGVTDARNVDPFGSPTLALYAFFIFVWEGLLGAGAVVRIVILKLTSKHRT